VAQVSLVPVTNPASIQPDSCLRWPVQR
jgi:hypothetical protein